MPSPLLRSPLRILLLITATLWVGALSLTIGALARIATLTEQTRTDDEAIRSLDPEMNRFETYWQTVQDLFANTESAPHIHAWIQTQYPALSPSSYKEQTTKLEHSHLKMRTATATWEAIESNQLQTIVATVRNAPASYRLCAITLSPAPQDTKLKVVATFRAFTQ